MPPRKVVTNKTGKLKKRARLDGSSGSGVNDVIEPCFDIDSDNRYLFRDVDAFDNFTGQFEERNLCDCFYFDKSKVVFNPREDNKIIEYIDHWDWEPLINCLEPYLKLTTQTFYANLKYTKTPFSLSSWVGGKEIHLSLQNVAEWLNLPNDGEETYILRNWPIGIESSDSWKKWFDRDNVAGGPIYATSLPSLHRLLFLFINNILIPKAKIKTNIEHGPMYYLRHLIQMDDTSFNIPYIILKHMYSAFRSTVAHLPYAHLIHKIIRLNNIELPFDQHYLFPQHLVNFLTKIDWVQAPGISGLMRFKPDSREINDWIFHPEALPNQYWDPEEMAQDPQAQAPPVNQPIPPYQYQYMPQFQIPPGQPAPFPPIPENQNDQMMWLCQRMQEQHFAMGGMQEGLRRVEGQLMAQAKTIQSIDKRQQSLSRRFVNRFGAASSSAPTNQEGEDDDEIDFDQLNEEEEDETVNPDE